MTNEKLLELAAENCRQAIADCAAAEQNATDFYRAGNEKQYKIWRATLQLIHDRAEDDLAGLDELEKEFEPGDHDDAQEDALADAEGRNTAAMLDDF